MTSCLLKRQRCTLHVWLWNTVACAVNVNINNKNNSNSNNKKRLLKRAHATHHMYIYDPMHYAFSCVKEFILISLLGRHFTPYIWPAYISATMYSHIRNRTMCCIFIQLLPINQLTSWCHNWQLDMIFCVEHNGIIRISNFSVFNA